jgi:hypothetical protein
VIGCNLGNMNRFFLSPLFTQRRGKPVSRVRINTKLESHPAPITVRGSPVAGFRVNKNLSSRTLKLLLGKVQNKRSRKFVCTILPRTFCRVWKDAANSAQARRSAEEARERPCTEERRPWWQRGSSEPDV